jgi:hypothetical protein
MSDSFIDVEESASPTKKVDTEQLTVGVETVERERQQVAGAAATEIARVIATDPVGSEMALVVRPAVPSIGLAVSGPNAHDEVATQKPVLMGGYASAGAPTPVGADGDAVEAWLLRNGAQVVDVSIAQSTSLDVEGETSHGVIQGGKPVSVGGIARSADDKVDNGDAVRLMASLLGKLVNLPYTLPANHVDGAATLTLASDVAIIAAPGVGSRLYITSVSGSNTNVTTDVRVDIKDGTTIFASFFCAAGGGGFSHSMPVGKRLADNAALQMALSAAVTDVRVSAQGYKATE